MSISIYHNIYCTRAHTCTCVCVCVRVLEYYIVATGIRVFFFLRERKGCRAPASRRVFIIIIIVRNLYCSISILTYIQVYVCSRLQKLVSRRRPQPSNNNNVFVLGGRKKKYVIHIVRSHTVKNPT